MATQAWKTLYERIAKISPGVRYLPKPTDRALDVFEAQNGFRFPRSYRDYIKVFGPGRLGGICKVYAPGYTKTRKALDLSDFNKFYEEWWKDEISNELGAVRHTRLILFCHTDTNDVIGWDPKDVRKATTHEYGIYYWPRHSKELQLIYTSFREFVYDFCLSTGAYRVWNEDPRPEAHPDREVESFYPGTDTSRRGKSAKKAVISRKRNARDSSKIGRPEISRLQRFEFIDGKSKKFWEIRRFANSVVMRSGRIGSSGQSTSREFATLEAAEKERKKLIEQRLAKGYKKARQR